jgi:hypothetical protein
MYQTRITKITIQTVSHTQLHLLHRMLLNHQAVSHTQLHILHRMLLNHQAVFHTQLHLLHRMLLNPQAMVPVYSVNSNAKMI